MAIQKLPVDYVQDVIDTSVSESRRYQMTENTDGTISLEDKTTYLVVGSDFGADDINSTNSTVNEVIDNLEEIELQAGLDFILCNQKALTFTNKICSLSDQRITNYSLADVYFTSDTYNAAEEAVISVETSAGLCILTAVKDPEGEIKATIRIRVVE